MGYIQVPYLLGEDSSINSRLYQLPIYSNVYAAMFKISFAVQYHRFRRLLSLIRPSTD